MGHAEVTAGSGDVRVREIDGTAVIKNSNGDTWIGAVTGDLRVNAANGNIAVDVAHGGVDAKTANGDVRLGEVVRGSVVLETALGDLEVGIREGTAAWLEVNATAGQGAQLARGRRRAASDQPRPSRCAPAPPSATIVIRRPENHDHAPAIGHRRHRPAQVLRRPTSCSTASTSTSPRARSSRCSAPTAPARPPWSRSSPP